MNPIASDLVEGIARELSDGRRIFRKGDGSKTFCALCEREKRRSRPTLSITAQDEKLLVFCYRCNGADAEIIRELVVRGLLPDRLGRSAVFVAIERIRMAAATTVWRGTASATDLLVLHSLIGVVNRCLKGQFGTSVREVALAAHISEVTASRALRRLVKAPMADRRLLELPEGAPDKESIASRPILCRRVR